MELIAYAVGRTPRQAGQYSPLGAVQHQAIRTRTMEKDLPTAHLDELQPSSTTC